LTTTRKSQRLAYAALLAVCIFWGTTYLSIRIGLEPLPPGYLIGMRYLLSGSILLVEAMLAGIRFRAKPGLAVVFAAMPSESASANCFSGSMSHTCFTHQSR
jgi:drug/metabolite transporter (DMT)-like permease